MVMTKAKEKVQIWSNNSFTKGSHMLLRHDDMKYNRSYYNISFIYAHVYLKMFLAYITLNAINLELFSIINLFLPLFLH